MGEFLDQIPENIQGHIREITKSSGLSNTDESAEKIAEGWLEKEKAFEKEIENADMEEVEIFEKDDEQGAIALTYSGSLVNIGPIIDDVRKVGYASIGLRKDVPDLITDENSEIASDIKKDESIEFKKGPVKKTSPIYKIVVCSEDLSIEEQEEKINEATMIIMDDFIEVNKTLIDE